MLIASSLADQIARRTRPTDARDVGRLAVASLWHELALEPKPGLVSLRDTGAHDDMSATTFIRSLFALRGYFRDVAEAGAVAVPAGRMRELGCEAEARMLRATGGVGVFVRYCGVHFFSIAARMLAGSAPELKSCIDSLATSTQIAHPKPCVSHLVTLPAASRAPMKQFSLLRCPSASQPQ